MSNLKDDSHMFFDTQRFFYHSIKLAKLARLHRLQITTD